MNVEKQRFEQEARRAGRVADYVAELSALFCNATFFTGLASDISPAWVLRCLLEKGYTVKDKRDGRFYIGLPTGEKDSQGEFTRFYLLAGNGKQKGSSAVKRDNLFIYRANLACFPYIGRFIACAEEMASIDAAIDVNLLNSQTTKVILTENQEMARNVRAAFDDAYIGLPLVIAIKRAIGEEAPTTFDYHADFIADRLHDLKNKIWTDELKRCGIVSANDYKRERVQTAEVNAGAGETIDYIYTLIDTFNSDAERQGQPERLEFNGYAKIYDTETEENENANPDFAE